MKTITVEVDVVISALLHEVFYTNELPKRKREAFMHGAEAFLMKYQEDASVFGKPGEEQWISINYHLLMGEIVILFRANHIEEEQEWLALSMIDSKLDKYVEENHYL